MHMTIITESKSMYSFDSREHGWLFDYSRNWTYHEHQGDAISEVSPRTLTAQVAKRLSSIRKKMYLVDRLVQFLTALKRVMTDMSGCLGTR